jgi:hypothetical protein
MQRFNNSTVLTLPFLCALFVESDFSAVSCFLCSVVAIGFPFPRIRPDFGGKKTPAPVISAGLGQVMNP